MTVNQMPLQNVWASVPNPNPSVVGALGLGVWYSTRMAIGLGVRLDCLIGYTICRAVCLMQGCRDAGLM